MSIVPTRTGGILIVFIDAIDFLMSARLPTVRPPRLKAKG
jgi:hypothetical protein